MLNATDSPSRQRIYLYTDKGQGIHPEAGVGGSAHEVGLRNVYDFDADPQILNRGADWQAFETALMDAGFDSYLYREHNLSAAVVLLGTHAVPVAYRGFGNAATVSRGGVEATTPAPSGSHPGTGPAQRLQAMPARGAGTSSASKAATCSLARETTPPSSFAPPPPRPGAAPPDNQHGFVQVAAHGLWHSIKRQRPERAPI